VELELSIKFKSIDLSSLENSTRFLFIEENPWCFASFEANTDGFLRGEKGLPFFT
jgi:hypothetical protein